MSLDIWLTAMSETPVYEANITHNLAGMADAAGIYVTLWNADKQTTTAFDLIQPLQWAIDDMEKRPDFYKHFDAENGWGTYDDFVPWLEELLEACKMYPNAKVEISK